MLGEFDKWPLMLQILAGLGAVLAGALVYLKSRNSVATSFPELSIKDIKQDMAQAIHAIQQSVNDQIHQHIEKSEEHWNIIEDRLRKVETKVEVLYDRQRHDRGFS